MAQARASATAEATVEGLTQRLTAGERVCMVIGEFL
jgi:hypothetical protein